MICTYKTYDNDFEIISVLHLIYKEWPKKIQKPHFSYKSSLIYWDVDCLDFMLNQPKLKIMVVFEICFFIILICLFTELYFINSREVYSCFIYTWIPFQNSLSFFKICVTFLKLVMEIWLLLLFYLYVQINRSFLKKFSWVHTSKTSILKSYWK